MRRRKFITGTLGAATVLAFGHVSSECLAIQKALNTFAEEDTLAKRVDKLNALMGTSFVLHLDRVPKGVKIEDRLPFADTPSTHVFDDAREEGGMGDAGWRVSLWQHGKRYTGCMGLKVMFHWTAQVALGYRIAKGLTA